MIGRIALLTIGIAFVIAELLRPTLMQPKKIVSHALLVASQDVAKPRIGTLDQELLNDLPRIRPDAPVTITFARDNAIIGTAIDPYTRSAGAAVFPLIDHVRIAAAATQYREAGYTIQLPSTVRRGTHTIAVGLIANDQRGYFKSAKTLTLHAP